MWAGRGRGRGRSIQRWWWGLVELVMEAGRDGVEKEMQVEITEQGRAEHSVT